MKREMKQVRNLVAKHAHKSNKCLVHNNKLKQMEKRACRGSKPSSLFWLI